MGRGLDRELVNHARWCRAWSDQLYLRIGVMTSREVYLEHAKRWARREEHRIRRRARMRRKHRRGWA